MMKQESRMLDLNHAGGVPWQASPTTLIEMQRLTLDLQEHLKCHTGCIDMLCERAEDSAWVQACWSPTYDLYLQAALPWENILGGPDQVWARLERLGWMRQSESSAAYSFSGDTSPNISPQVAVHAMVCTLVQAFEVDPLGLHFHVLV
jgi:hypothetical protein